MLCNIKRGCAGVRAASWLLVFCKILILTNGDLCCRIAAADDVYAGHDGVGADLNTPKVEVLGGSFDFADYYIINAGGTILSMLEFSEPSLLLIIGQ